MASRRRMPQNPCIMGRPGLLRDIRKQYDLYLLLVPGLLVLFVFRYVPMYGVSIAFQRFSVFTGYFGSPFVGLENFFDLFQDPFFPRLLRNTLLLGVYSLIWGFFPPIVLALLLNEVRGAAYKRIVQSISYLPHFVSTVIVVGMLHKLTATDGVINQLLASVGWAGQKFLTDPRWFRLLYIGSGVWQEIGWGSIIYLAALAGIDVALYEAAMVEGATRSQRVRWITLPCLAPTAVILLILNVRHVVSVGFEKVYLMYSPAVYETADVFSTYVYRRGIAGGDYSYATAVELFNSLVAHLLIVACNRVARSLGETSLW